MQGFLVPFGLDADERRGIVTLPDVSEEDATTT
jgi:hypothetical protein